MPSAAAAPDVRLATAVMRHLRRRDGAWAAPVLAAETVDSTSERLKELARAGAVPWTTYVARAQSHGRGRHGRVWQSPPGNLYLSTLLGTRAPSGAGVLPLAGGVAVVEAAREWGVAARLKWPNDVLVGGRKLAGVLVEGATGGRGLEHVVVGVGVNLDWEAEHMALAGANATCVRAESGAAPELAAAAAAVVWALRDWARRCAQDACAVVEAWRERAVAWWGEAVEVQSGAERVSGRLRGVDDDGALLLELEDGRLARLLSGDVSRLRPSGVAR